MLALKHFYRELGDGTWGWMGFYDAFNQGRNWWADSYLAIDQGPILLMIENHRTGMLWDLFMANPEIPPMMEAIGFRASPNALEETGAGDPGFELYPNPARDRVRVDVSLTVPARVSIQLFDSAGQLKTNKQAGSFGAGRHSLELDATVLEPGLYLTRLVLDGRTAESRKMIIH
jgi:hypothetical protein